MNDPRDTLNLKEVAKLLGVSTRTIYNWAQTNYIPSFKLGKSWRFKKSEITEWMNSNRTRIPSIDFEVSNYNRESMSDMPPYSKQMPDDNDIPPYAKRMPDDNYIPPSSEMNYQPKYLSQSESYSSSKNYSKGQYIKSYDKWLIVDDIKLKNLYLKEKLSTKEIGEKFNRSEESIRSRLKKNFVYLRDEYYPAMPDLYKKKYKDITVCPKCGSKVILNPRILNVVDEKNRKSYICLGTTCFWGELVAVDSADENKNAINEEETKINLFTNHIEIEMSKRPDGVLSFEVFEQDYSQDTINEGLKRLEPFGYKLQETQVTKHKFIMRG